MKSRIKKHKSLFIILIILLLATIAYGVTYFVIISSYHKDLQLPTAHAVQIDVKHYDSDTYFSIEDTKAKQELLDLIRNKLEFEKLYLVDYPFDSEHNTYSIIIWSWSDNYFCIFYVSNKAPDYCIIDGKKFKYYIKGGDKIADYLDEYSK